MKSSIEKFDSKSDDEYVRHRSKKDKAVPTEYAQDFQDVLNLVSVDIQYVSDPVNAKYLDNFDLANIFYKLYKKTQKVQSRRLDIYPCTYLTYGAPKNLGHDWQWYVSLQCGYQPLNSITKTVGNLFIGNKTQAVCQQLQSRLIDVKQYMKSCQSKVTKFAKREDILDKHNHKHDKNYNETVGVHIDNVVNNHENG